MEMKELRAIESAYKALCVIYLDPKINAFLRSFDLKALEQVSSALDVMESNIEGIQIPEGRSPASDFEVENHFSLYLLRPLTTEAWDWIEEHLSTDCNWFANAVAVEHRYIADIVNGIRADGLSVQ
jgi:hypothetical protein